MLISSRVRVRTRFGVWLVSAYAHVFIQLSFAIVAVLVAFASLGCVWFRVSLGDLVAVLAYEIWGHVLSARMWSQWVWGTEVPQWGPGAKSQ